MWTKPKQLFDKPGAFDRQPVVEVTKEKWILPMYYTPSRGIRKGAESNYSVVEITTDAGKTWNECEIPESSGLVQPSVVPVDHHYVAFFRSRFADWIYKSTSDDGCHWEAPVSTKLPNNNASIQVVKLNNGHLVIAFNNVNATDVKGKPTTGPRVPLSVALSEDGGKTWPWVRDIETNDPEFGKEFTGLSDKPGREEYSYPSIMQMPDGKIGSAYTFRRETIKFVEFDENWIKKGGTQGKFKGD
jgi:predicted neuraminidase